MIETILNLDWKMLLEGIVYLIAGASAIAAVTPTPKDDAILVKIKKVVDVAALNVGQAKPADKEE